MLELHNIVKQYPAGDGVVHALRGIDLKFRENEFVSILGPSGSGKTTLLNIIGGLDQYTSGDLVINDKSTKGFKDRDWDAYRNYSIGFVFQSYNLIPHQTVLQNVELALTVSGISKEERKRRATVSLEQVGLGDQLNKRPNQISGGQMQRVAIARALVNDPDIILADEPTGALDTETSKQVMDILKEIADDRLIIMVTHNPKLANEYSSRIIQMLDGEITSDSAPISNQELKQIKESKRADEKKETTKNPSMSFATSFMLSLKNLFTKKGRTTLTAFAGSIGIMGIALIIAVSQGMTLYIDSVQEDALSSYPLTIEETNVDMSMLMETFMNVGNSEIEHDKDAVYKKTAIYDMMSAIDNIESTENDLKSFKTFIETEYQSDEEENELGEAITGLQYSYDLGLNVYTKNVDGDIIKSDTQNLLQELMSEHMGTDVIGLTFDPDDNSPFSGMDSFQNNMDFGIVSMNLWQEILPGKDGEPVNEVLKKQYDVVHGDWPQNYDEVVLVLDNNNELDDLSLYALGLEPKENIDAIMDAALNGAELEKSESSWSYDEITNNEYRVILNADSYGYDEQTELYTDLRNTEAGLRYLYDDALALKVTGIIRPNENAESTMLSGSIAYTNDLTEYIVENSKTADVVKDQKENEEIDILTGLPFESNTGSLSATEKEAELKDYLSQLSEKDKANAYIDIMSIPPQEQIDAMIEETTANFERSDIEDLMLGTLTEDMGVDEETVKSYLASMSDDEINELFVMALETQFKEEYAEETRTQLINVDQAQLAAMLDQDLNNYTTDEAEIYYDEVVVFSENSYEGNLAQMGYIDLDSPSAINIYASSFKNKDIIEDAIATYNEDVPELSQIKYTDYLGIIMSSITTIINAITYVLLAFVAISLIVSSIMIGVITLISVQERTKEIGILRAIGASKADVSSMFNAETMIIGFASGLLGVLVTYLLTIPINIILHNVTGIENLNATLPINVAIVLIIISIGLSLIAGIIPSRSAAKKDPVVALRTE